MERALSAPGKLFVCGEYAVLWGGAARVAAVAPRNYAFVRRRDDAEVHVVLAEGRLQGRVTPLGVRWERPVPEGFRFVARALDEVLAAKEGAGLGFVLALSPTPSAPGGGKHGLGSSARSTLLAVEAARYVLEAKLDPLKVALVAHAQTQGMKGSGGDVAACFAGGLIRYRRYPVEEITAPGRPRATAYRDAPGVELSRIPVRQWNALYVHAGASASTPKLIAAAEQKMDEEARALFVQRSDVLGQALEDGLFQNSFEALADALEGLRALLGGLGTVETEEIRRILAMAEVHGCAGKTSGAGGGDGCLVFCPDETRRLALLDAYQSRGIQAFALALQPGLTGEAEPLPELKAWASA